jgi:hypothetical protein
VDAVFEINDTFWTKSNAAINFNKLKFKSIDFLNTIQDLIKENTNQQGSIGRLKHPSKEISKKIIHDEFLCFTYNFGYD